MITDPIADMLIRIQNGYMARRTQVLVPYSGFKQSLLEVLKKCGYIASFTKKDDRMFSVTLQYTDGQPALTKVNRISKPGIRRYVRLNDMAALKPGLGHVILSTPQGVMTHVEARRAQVGGEVICKVY